MLHVTGVNSEYNGGSLSIKIYIFKQDTCAFKYSDNCACDNIGNYYIIQNFIHKQTAAERIDVSLG